MSRHYFNPPPRITAMADLNNVARTHSTEWQTVKEVALHESAHALAAIIFKRQCVMTIIRSNGVGKTWYYPRPMSNHGELYEEAVMSFCGLAAEQLVQCEGSDVVPDAAQGDLYGANAEVSEYAARCIESPPPRIKDWLLSRSPKQLAVLEKRVENHALKDSLRDSRTLVYNYWPLIEEMAFAALRDSKDGLHFWTGARLDWVCQRVAEIDVGKQVRKTAYPRPKWLRKVGGERKNKDLLRKGRELSARISFTTRTGS